jgi:hypothetical protein
MFGIGMPEIIILMIIAVFLIVVVTSVVVLTVFLLKKWGIAKSSPDKSYLFCPKCGARLEVILPE